MEIVIIPLAKKKMAQRGIPEAWLEETIRKPTQVVEGYGGRRVYQRRYQVPARREQLLRVVCEQGHSGPIVVVTAYLTSEVQRYWRS